MTKHELIVALAAACDMDPVATKEAVDNIVATITNGLAAGNRIELRGFGVFTPRQYKAYEGRNPRTGAVVHVTAKVLPTFKMGKELRDALKGGA